MKAAGILAQHRDCGCTGAMGGPPACGFRGKPAVRIPQGASGPRETATCRTRDDYVAQRRRAIRKQY